MGRIWEDQNKYQRWLDVELAVTETLAANGIVPKDAAAEIKANVAMSIVSAAANVNVLKCFMFQSPTVDSVVADRGLGRVGIDECR